MADRPAHDVCAIVVAHESKRWLSPALSSLFEHAGALDLDVVVVDNGSDGSAEYVRGSLRARSRHPLREPRLRPRQQPRAGDGRCPLPAASQSRHRGGRGHACGARVLHGRPSRGRPRRLPSARRATASSGRPCGASRASAARLGEAIGPERLPFLAARLGESELDLSRYDEELSCDWTSGSFMLVRREALESAGPLDERFFFYSEEVDLCLRIKRSGWEIRHLPQLTIAHYGGKTNSSPRMEAQMAYARSQYAAKHFGPLRRTAFVAAIALRHLVRWVAFSLRGGGERAKAQRQALMTLLGREAPPFSQLSAPALSGCRSSTTSAFQSSSISSAQIRCEWSSPARWPSSRPCDRIGSKYPRAEARRVEQHLARVLAQVAAQPVRQRHREALLGAVEDRVGQPGPQGVAQDPLLLHPPQLHLGRDRRRRTASARGRGRASAPRASGPSSRCRSSPAGRRRDRCERRPRAARRRRSLAGGLAPRARRSPRRRRGRRPARRVVGAVEPARLLWSNERDVALVAVAGRRGRACRRGGAACCERSAPRRSPAAATPSAAPSRRSGTGTRSSRAAEHVGRVARVAGEALVAAVAVERDGHVAPGQLGEVEARDRRGVGERLAVVAGELRRDLDRVGPHQQLLVLGAEELGDLARVGELVEALGVEADREGPHRLARSPAPSPRRRRWSRCRRRGRRRAGRRRRAGAASPGAALAQRMRCELARRPRPSCLRA